MKIFWLVNVIFPFPSRAIGANTIPYGGWLIGLLNEIRNNKNIDEICISTVYNGKDLKKIVDNNIIYYLVPNNNHFDFWKNIINDFNPDLIHLHGTEFKYGFFIRKLFPNKKIITSIQGLVSEISKYYIANVNFFDIIKNFTFRDLIKGNIYCEQRKFERRGIIEKKILKYSDAIIGRTNWDFASSFSIVGEDKYFKCNEILRTPFYNGKWDVNHIEKYSIFVTRAGAPFKGFHILLNAAYILKNIYGYSNLKIYVAGNNINDTSSIINKMRLSGYSKYIISLIKKLDLSDNIIFTGLLNENEVLSMLEKTNVFVQSSSIENSPNSLGEAMLVGVPCVASNVGGTSDMLVDKVEGYLYPFGDYNLLAYYISKIFDNSKKSVELGKNARKHALITHDRKINSNKMIDIYMEVLKNEK